MCVIIYMCIYIYVFPSEISMFDLFPKAAIASNWEAQVSLGWDFEGEG